MNIKLQIANDFSLGLNSIILFLKDENLSSFNFSEIELNYINEQIQKKQKAILINRLTNQIFLIMIEIEGEKHKIIEKIRQSSVKPITYFKENKTDTVSIFTNHDPNYLLAFAEGVKLFDYQFIKYFKDADEKASTIQEVILYNDSITEIQIGNLNSVIDSVHFVRNLINEPVNFLNTIMFEDIITKESASYGLKCDIWDKNKLIEQNMNGILAVNKGSIDPPFFAIIEWKPENAINEKPIVLVGKGVTFDTGGLSLKPTADSMDYMKVDMGGAAVVFGTMIAIAKNKLPKYVIALIPSTDNRPDGNAYAPGDIIRMRNDLTVEVLNTDAEGRMILADALHFATELNPELVISVATLTGAASVAIGPLGIVGMGNADEKWMNQLKSCGNNVYERIVEFPFWEEYGESIKSDIADLKNVGGKFAGMITAGKFLEHFTNYPYIHLDIAGVTHLKASDSYRSKGASGIGMRLLYDFISNIDDNINK